MAACHAGGGSWLVMSVRGAFAAIFNDLEQVASLSVG
jgi:hypothetical protein